MLPVVAALGTVLGSTVANWVVRFLAFKAILVILVTITLPIIIKNLVYWFFETMSSFIAASLPDNDFSGVILEMSGLMGYLAQQLRLTDCMAVFVTALVVRSIIMFIPFVK